MAVAFLQDSQASVQVGIADSLLDIRSDPAEVEHSVEGILA